MAPEVAEGQQAEPASDLYSVGCLLYELLAGTAVFTNSDPVAEIEAHFSQEPVSVRSLRPEVPVELDALTRELLAKVPSGRPSDARFVFARLLYSATDLPPLPGVIRSASGPNPSQLYAIVQERISFLR